MFGSKGVNTFSSPFACLRSEAIGLKMWEMMTTGKPKVDDRTGEYVIGADGKQEYEYW